MRYPSTTPIVGCLRRFVTREKLFFKLINRGLADLLQSKMGFKETAGKNGNSIFGLLKMFNKLTIMKNLDYLSVGQKFFLLGKTPLIFTKRRLFDRQITFFTNLNLMKIGGLSGGVKGFLITQSPLLFKENNYFNLRWGNWQNARDYELSLEIAQFNPEEE